MVRCRRRSDVQEGATGPVCAADTAIGVVSVYIERAKCPTKIGGSGVRKFLFLFSLLLALVLIPSPSVSAATGEGCKIPNGGDVDNNGIGDAGVQVVCNYTSVYAYDAFDDYYWDLGD